jgi:feruloyl esterase
MAMEDLSGIPDAATQIVSAKNSSAGSADLSFCLIAGYVAPDVGVKMGLPATWNGKFIELGCGGHCGILPKDEEFSSWCGVELRKGYACIVSDMGHRGALSDQALWASNNLQAKVDFGYRATHVVAVAGKAIAERYYAHKARNSYFMGCSTGGRQALEEAQRFPWDFNGIVAGAPPIDLAVLYMTEVWNAKVAHDAGGKTLLTPDDLKLVHKAAVAKCGVRDGLKDGLKDGVIDDPLHCEFDPGELACKPGRTRDCLSAEQISAVKKIYRGPVTSAEVALSTGGPLPGSESEHWEWAGGTWNGLTAGDESAQESTGRALYRLFLSTEAPPGWRPRDFDFDRDYQRLSGSLYDSSNPDLRRFKAAGGKLIVYQGLNDPWVPPRATIDYYETVERTLGGRAATQDFFRLFTLPGMDHCSFGDGAFAVDWLGALEGWVEQGHAPARLIASHVNVDDLSYDRPADMQRIERRVAEFPLDPATVQFSRPVYPYPTQVKYKGSGDLSDAANFVPVR